jgi:RNA polymerase sigma-70 factor (ECF subfamily)
MDEQRVIKQCLSGSAEQYALLVDRYKDMAYTIAYRIVGDGDTARDMAQESFIAAYSALKDFRGNSKFSSWLYRIIVNKCKDHLRARCESVSVEMVAEVLPGRERTPEQTASARQTGDLVQKALNRMPLEYREVIVLKHIEGLSYEEIASIVGDSVPALKVRACRGREMLRNVLEHMGVMA